VVGAHHADPGSHAYDVRRTRLRAEYDGQGVPDQRADRAANAELQRDHPPRAVGERAAGPPGGGGGVEEDGGLNARSAAFSGHTMIPDRYSYEGGNTSPPMEWSDVPSGAVVRRNGFGEQGWGGPRPPVGDEPHRYIFRVCAVDRPLGLGEGVTSDDVRSAIEGRVLAHGTPVGLFAR
jgi:hypothetical protein